MTASTAVTVGQFREDFEEFSDDNVFASSTILFWLKIAQGDPKTTPPLNGLLNQARWKSQYNLASELFVAHNLALEKLARDAAALGATPGLGTGPVNSKSVDKVSVGYDTQAGISPDAGHWNLTTYGTRLWWLIQMFGMGSIQIIGCQTEIFPFFTPTAYSGPYPGV